MARNAEDADVLRRIREGDESAFRALVQRHHAGLVRLARCYVKTSDAAEEVVQDAWMGLLRGLDRFEGRSSLGTWLFRILTNTAKDRARRDGRTTPFSAMVRSEVDPDEPSVDPEMFQGRDGVEPGHWRAAIPVAWTGGAEEDLLTRETLAVARKAIDTLPGAQRAVLLLRDDQGYTARETCNILGLTETNQRVLLHRARNRVRRAVNEHFSG